MRACVCVCVSLTQSTKHARAACVSARTCLWTGQMGKREEESQIKKDDSREKRGRRGEMGREDTWSGNASVPLRPATSYHGASTDRWMQESPIIEMLENKHPNEGERLLRTSWCVRMAGGDQDVARGPPSPRQLPISGNWCKYTVSDPSQRLRQLFFLLSQSILQYCYHGNIVPWALAYYPRWLILPIYSTFLYCASALFLNVSLMQLPGVKNKVSLRWDLMWEQLTRPQKVFERRPWPYCDYYYDTINRTISFMRWYND